MYNEEKENLLQQSRPYPVEKELTNRREFSEREVGITHPDLSSFIRLNDQGDIEIFAAPGVGIIISSRSKSVSIFGDSLRMFVKEDGLRWNSYNFNYSASNFIEPTLVKINNKTIHSAINGTHHFLSRLKDLEDEEMEKEVTIDPEYKFGKMYPEIPTQNYSDNDSYDGLTIDQIGLIEAYAPQLSSSRISYIIKLLKEGHEFQQAYDKAMRELNE